MSDIFSRPRRRVCLLSSLFTSFLAILLLSGCTQITDVVVINFSREDIQVSLGGPSEWLLIKKGSYVVVKNVHYGVVKNLNEGNTIYCDVKPTQGKPTLEKGETFMVSEKKEDAFYVLSVTNQ